MHRDSGLLGFLTEKWETYNLGVLVSGKGFFPLSDHVLLRVGWADPPHKVQRVLVGSAGAERPGEMGPQVALLVVALAGCLLPARSCVTCDRRVVAALDSFDKEYLPTHLAPERHREVMRTIGATVGNFTKLPNLQRSFIGVIGEGRVERGNPGSWETRGLVLAVLGRGEGDGREELKAETTGFRHGEGWDAECRPRQG